MCDIYFADENKVIFWLVLKDMAAERMHFACKALTVPERCLKARTPAGKV